MAKKKATSFSRLFLFLFALAAVAAVVAIVFQANKSTEQRSKAAEEAKVYDAWEFNGLTTEGWTGQGVGLNVFGGNLNVSRLKNPQESTLLQHTKVNTVLPVGQKMIQVELAVGDKINPTLGVEDRRLSQTACPQDIKICPDGTNITRNPNRNCQFDPCPSFERFTMLVEYMLEGKTVWEPPLTISGNADSQFQQYSAELPRDLSLQSITISQLRFNFSQLPPEAFVRFNRILLLGAK